MAKAKDIENDTMTFDFINTKEYQDKIKKNNKSSKRGNNTKNIKKEEVIDINKEKKRLKNGIIRLSVKIIFVFAFLYITFGFIFGLTKMKTSYMQPSLTEGDLILYYRMNREYHKTDVIVFEQDNKEYIMRIVAMGGDSVEINDAGELLINGFPEEHTPYYETNKADNSDIVYPIKLSRGELFVVNDYRKQTKDSRQFGVIKIEQVKGKVFSRLQVRNI